jgi:hypothetical protein
MGDRTGAQLIKGRAVGGGAAPQMWAGRLYGTAILLHTPRRRLSDPLPSSAGRPPAKEGERPTPSLASALPTNSLRKKRTGFRLGGG